MGSPLIRESSVGFGDALLTNSAFVIECAISGLLLAFQRSILGFEETHAKEHEGKKRQSGLHASHSKPAIETPLKKESPISKCLQRLRHSAHSRRSTIFLVVLACKS